MMNTLKHPVTGELKVLRSRFICSLYPATDPETARQKLSEHTARYADATHNCYAYICGLKQETIYYSDAGEPGGTAGKPILNVLLRHELTNVLAVVTRYYGGIKLGVKGLIEAYGNAVENGIANAELIVARQLVQFRITCEYTLLEMLKHKISEFAGEFGEPVYAQRVTLAVAIPREFRQSFTEILDGYHSQSRLDYYVE